MIDMDNLNATYQDIITTFVLNTMLHHVGMLWMIETHVISYKYMCYTRDHLIPILDYVCTYHIVIIHVFQLSITYQHGVTFYSTQNL